MSTIHIPKHWDADTALTVAYFFENIIVAIWNIHGQKMGQELEATYNQGSLSAFPDLQDEEDPDEEIPF